MIGNILEDVVRVFYFLGDARIFYDYGVATDEKYDDHFRTHLLRDDFKVSENKVRHILGYDVYNGGESEMLVDFDLVKACRVVCNDERIAAFTSETNLMDPDNRILHLMVSQTIHPRGGNFTTVSQEEIRIMYRIIMDTPPNLCGLIIKKMLDAVSWCKLDSNNFGLPYRKLVTKIYYSKFDLYENATVETNKGMVLIKRASIMAMGFKENKETKEWQRVRVEQGETTTQAGSSSQQNVDMASLMQSMISMHKATMMRMYERFNEVMTCQRSLQDQVHYVNNNVEHMRRAQNLPPYPGPYPFYQPPHNP